MLLLRPATCTDLGVDERAVAGIAPDDHNQRHGQRRHKRDFDSVSRTSVFGKSVFVATAAAQLAFRWN